MTTNKDFKRLVRSRMRRTGESYTAARARLVLRRSTTTAPTTAPTAATADYAKLAGMSDAAVKAATGCTWARWVKALDRAEAYTWPHAAIVRYAHQKYRTPDWWAQMVIVGYERIKGLRERGQRREGDYEATKSRTFPVPAAALYAAIRNARRRAWLDGARPTLRSEQPPKSLRFLWSDGRPVELWFTAKGRDKSAVQVQHRRLPDKATALAMKAYWTERLDALAAQLG